MTIAFLFAGLFLVLVGVGIIISELNTSSQWMKTKGKIVGYTADPRTDHEWRRFQTVVEYRGRDYQTRYIVSAIGSSSPLGTIGKEVTVHYDGADSSDARIESSVSTAMGIFLSVLGAGFIFVFVVTFKSDWFSVAMAIFISLASARGAWKLRSNLPAAFKEIREIKKKVPSFEVFSESDKDKICWADPKLLNTAFDQKRRNYLKATPVAFALGIGLVVLSHSTYRNTEQFLTRAIRADGKVIEFSERSGDATTYAAVVDFHNPETRQTERLVDSFSSTHPLYEINEAVTVLIDPAHKKTPSLDRGVWNYLLPFGTLVFGLLLTWFGIHTFKRYREARRFVAISGSIPNSASRSA